MLFFLQLSNKPNPSSGSSSSCNCSKPRYDLSHHLSLCRPATPSPPEVLPPGLVSTRPGLLPLAPPPLPPPAQQPARPDPLPASNLQFQDLPDLPQLDPQALRMSEKEIIEHAGLDSAVYLRIYILGCIAVTTTLPIGVLQEAGPSLIRKDIGNVSLHVILSGCDSGSHSM
ncbi:hypothetical protein AAC387_Pa09g1457 [Persea americana]